MKGYRPAVPARIVMPAGVEPRVQPVASPIQSGVSGTGTMPRSGTRELFTLEELAVVLSHYDIGVIHSVVQFPRGSYHMAPAVEQGLKAITTHCPPALSGNPNLMPILSSLLTSYSEAAEAVERHGMETWPRQIVHADWHPGNMLFRDNHVVAVIDYDSARLLPRIVDAANGALQFSIIGGDEDVSKWPEYPDESRYKRFLRGYDEVMLLSEAEIRTIPWLMVEALIAEAVFPIAATGTFGRMEGLAFLQMVQRKITWMQHSADKLIELAAS